MTPNGRNDYLPPAMVLMADRWASPQVVIEDLFPGCGVLGGRGCRARIELGLRLETCNRRPGSSLGVIRCM
jgi:hypothetical protein